MNGDLFIIGNISWDTVRYDDLQARSFWGGAGLNVSLSASQLHVKPRLISVAGTDVSEFLLRAGKQIDVSLVKIIDGMTCRFEMKYSRDGTLEKTACAFGVARLMDSYLKKVTLPRGFYHVCCRLPMNPRYILRRIAGMKLQFSLDFILTSARAQIVQAREWLPYAQVVFVNYQEYEILSALYDIRRVNTLVITSASQPVRVLTFGKETLELPCGPRRFADVTGAGDVFIGTFLASKLKGDDARVSVEQAIASAMNSLDDLGAAYFLRHKT